jgi:hypothetical protein
MCRSIKQLRNPEQPPTDDDIYAAALQYVRKISGDRKPSSRNQVAFDAAVNDVATITKALIEALTARKLSIPNNDSSYPPT